MADFERRDILRTVGGAGTLAMAGLAGCSGGGSNGTTQSGDSTTSGTTSGAKAQAGADVNVGMVYALGGLGDKSFNDMANKGIKKAEEELGISYKNGQPGSQSAFSQWQRKFATATSPNYDLVCCVGFKQQAPLSKTAPNYPDQKFMLVDSVVDEPNVANYVFKEHEGSFLVGVLAGALTTQSFSTDVDGQSSATNADTKKVGFLGGVESDLIAKFEAGFRAGAQHVDSAIEVPAKYAGSFSDPSKGKEAALSMYNDGADIIYHAAGGTGLGVFQAAQEQGRYAIGVDSDQSKTQPNYANVILASMVKRTDTAVFRSVKSVVEGSYKGGEVTELGLKKDGVQCAYGATLGAEISADVKSKVSTARQDIIDGKITVPTSPN